MLKLNLTLKLVACSGVSFPTIILSYWAKLHWFLVYVLIL